MRFFELYERVGRTLSKPPLDREVVIRACGHLAGQIGCGFYETKMEEAGLFDAFSKEQLNAVSAMLSEPMMRERAARELPEAEGGDEAVSGIRRLAPPQIRLIEWGHRLSFAYVTKEGGRDGETLAALARHMVRTGQVLCSSCQGIYLEAGREEAWRFCLHFRDLLSQAYSEFGDQEAACIGRNTIEILHRELETSCTGDRICRGRGVSVTLAVNRAPELSLMYGNCWVKQINREELTETLRGSRGYLQTAVLICGENEEQTVIPTLARAGVTRIIRGKNLENSPIPATHDGEYPLSRYVKMVEID